MPFGPLHTHLPSVAAFFYATQLPQEDCIKVIDMLLCPLDARGHHDGRETILEDDGSVFDDGEVDERNLVNVHMKIAIKYALTG